MEAAEAGAAAPIGIVAGRGGLPAHLAARLAEDGRPVVLAQMAGFAAENPLGLPVIEFRVERLGTLFAALTEAGVAEIVFAGAVRRPKLDPAAFDARTLALAPTIATAMADGDDGTLRAVLAIFEAEGFAIRAAHDLVPELLPPAGLLGHVRPGEGDRKDAARAAAVVAAIAAADVGQAAIVAGGVALGVEAAPGTDALIAHVGAVAGPLRAASGAAGVLYKAPKPGQDRRIDLPLIGPATVDSAAAARLGGIVLEADGVMVLDPHEVARRADAAGLFVWVRPTGSAE